ncbi:MAG TPA: acyl-ACP thioesterase domain-containing protein [Candidatus Limnocylindrales bacterium]
MTATVPDPATMHFARVPYRARFDECGPDGLARPSALLRWAQDVAWIHSERLGFGREWYAERDMAWVVRAVELALNAPIKMGTTVEVETRVIGMRRVMARRRTEVRAPDGSLAASILNDWVMTDVRRAAPARVPAEFPALFGVPPEGYEPIRVSLPAMPGDAPRIAVQARAHEIDPMAHVNNAVYLDWLDEAVGATGEAGATAIATLPRTYRLEYLLPVGRGVAHVATPWPMDGGGWAYRLIRGDGPDALRGILTTG